MLDVSCGWEIIWKMLYIWLSAPPHFDHKTTRCNHAVAPLRSSFLMAFFLTGAKHKPAVQVKKTKQTKTNTIFNSIGMEGRGFFFCQFWIVCTLCGNAIDVLIQGWQLAVQFLTRAKSKCFWACGWLSAVAEQQVVSAKMVGTYSGR